jgi:hypothetical protein
LAGFLPAFVLSAAYQKIALRRLRFKVASLPPHASRRGFAFRFSAFVLFVSYGGFAAKFQFAVLKGRLTLQDCKVQTQGFMVFFGASLTARG